MKLYYSPPHNHAVLGDTPDDSYSLVAESIDPAAKQEGYIYLRHFPGTSLTKDRVVLCSTGGRFVQMCGAPQPLPTEVDEILLEFPHFKYGSRDQLDWKLLKLIQEHPTFRDPICALFRQQGIPIPPISVGWVSDDWIHWTLSCELQLSPLARAWIDGLENGGVTFTDRVFTPPVTVPEPTRRVRVAVSMSEDIEQHKTEYYNWSGDINIPVSVIEEGKDVVIDYIEEWVSDNINTDDANHLDTEYRDCETSCFEHSIDDYGDIDSLIEEFEEEPEEEDDENDN